VRQYVGMGWWEKSSLWKDENDLSTGLYTGIYTINWTYREDNREFIACG